MGTHRIAVTGERNGADVVTSLFAFQFKCRAMLPSWLFDWLDGIVGTAKRSDRIGVLVCKVPGMRDGDAIVMLRWADWVELHGSGKTSESDAGRSILP